MKFLTLLCVIALLSCGEAKPVDAVFGAHVGDIVQHADSMQGEILDVSNTHILLHFTNGVERWWAKSELTREEFVIIKCPHK